MQRVERRDVGVRSLAEDYVRELGYCYRVFTESEDVGASDREEVWSLVLVEVPRCIC